MKSRLIALAVGAAALCTAASQAQSRRVELEMDKIAINVLRQVNTAEATARRQGSFVSLNRLPVIDGLEVQSEWTASVRDYTLALVLDEQRQKYQLSLGPSVDTCRDMWFTSDVGTIQVGRALRCQ